MGGVKVENGRVRNTFNMNCCKYRYFGIFSVETKVRPN